MSDRSSSTTKLYRAKGGQSTSRKKSGARDYDKEKEQPPILLGFLALLLIGGGWYLWTAVLSKQISILYIQEGNKKVQVKSIDWQQTIFANPVFTSLSEPLEEPPIAGTSEGNPSPFTHRVKNNPCRSRKNFLTS